MKDSSADESANSCGQKRILAFFNDREDILSAADAFRRLLDAPESSSESICFPPRGRKPVLRALGELLGGEHDAALYSLENSPESALVERAAQLFPGFLLIHDYSFEELALNRLQDTDALQQELLNRFGSKEEALASAHIRHWGSEGLRQLGAWKSKAGDYGDSPLIVSCPSLLRFFPGAVHCPVPVQLEGDPGLREESREALGIASHEFVIGCAARNGHAGRGPLVRTVCEELRRAGQPIRLLRLIAPGDTASGEHDDFEITRPAGSLAELSATLRALDSFSGLHVSEFHGLPAPALFALAAGIPTLVSSVGGGRSLPNSSVLHIRPGFGETRETGEVIRELIENRSLRTALAGAGVEYIARNHAPALVRSRLTEIVQAHLPKLLVAGEMKREDYRRSRRELVNSRRDLFATAGKELTNTVPDALFQAANDLAC